MGKKFTTQQFIEKARNVHGGKYDYSKVCYIDAHTKVTIVCHLHGEFKQMPYGHLQGLGCTQCSILSKKHNTQQFIEKARNVHGNKYDYSKVKYVNSKKKVTIICPEHGDFQQQPGLHLLGRGCKKCSLAYSKKPLTKFIEQANIVHDNTYDYSKVQYINSRTNITIICPEHGEFKQKPSNHLQGYGCVLCKRKNKFLIKARQIHGDKYNYDKMHYIDVCTKITITCSEHGEFKQTPKNHLRGQGCPQCAKNSRQKLYKQQYNTQWFIAKAKEIHHDKYSYDNTEYVNAHTKVTILCPYHGEFKQLPDNHLHGHGCIKCGNNSKVTCLEEFIEEGMKIHDGKYSYKQSVYINTHTKIIITCPIHGNFEQTPNNHIYSQAGCPKCKTSGIGVYSDLLFDNNPELKDELGIVYVVRYNGYIKIGITKRKLNQRFSGISLNDILYVHNTTLYQAYLIEQHILNVFDSYRLKSIENKFHGWTECFENVNPGDIIYQIKAWERNLQQNNS